MTSIETRYATSIPISSIYNSFCVNPVPSDTNLSILTRLAPAITGIARKNVNSAAAVLDVPISIAPTIVAPERDVPGISASTWNNPIISAVLNVIALTSVILNSLLRLRISISINATPYIISVTDTT